MEGTAKEPMTLKEITALFASSKIELNMLECIFTNSSFIEAIFRDFYHHCWLNGIYERQYPSGLFLDGSLHAESSTCSYFSQQEITNCIEYTLIFSKSNKLCGHAKVFLAIFIYQTVAVANSKNFSLPQPILEQLEDILTATSKSTGFEQIIFVKYIYSGNTERRSMIEEWATPRCLGVLAGDTPTRADSRTCCEIQKKYRITNGSPCDIATFFRNELRYSRDTEFLTKIIKMSRSHEILHSKLDHLLKNLSREELNSVISSSYRMPCLHTERILGKIDENSVKSFIVCRKYSTPIIFQRCHTIDMPYVLASIHCRKHINSISNQDLTKLLNSEYLDVFVSNNSCFKALVNLSITRGLQIDVHRLIGKERDGMLWRVLYLTSRKVDVSKGLAMKVMGIEASRTAREDNTDMRKQANKRLVAAFMKLQLYKSLPLVFKTAREELLQALANQRDKTSFSMKCMQYLSDRALVAREELPISCNTGKCKRGDTRNRTILTQPENTPKPSESILMFNKSIFYLKNPYKKFTLIIGYVVNNTGAEAQRRNKNILLKLNSRVLIYIQDAHLYYNDVKIRRLDCTTTTSLSIKVEYKNKTVLIDGNDIQIPFNEVVDIRIDESYVGGISCLLYFYGSVPIEPLHGGTRIDMYRKVVMPLQRWLQSKNKNGVVLVDERPHLLNGSLVVNTKNLFKLKPINLNAKHSN